MKDNLINIHKILPKKHSHIKERSKVSFIRQAFKNYYEGKNSKIDFENTKYDTETGQIEIQYLKENIFIEDLAYDILEKWYFSNLSKNENVYFYRFVNVIRASCEADDFDSIIDDILDDTRKDEILKENIKQYLSYRKKLFEIDQYMKEKL